VKISILTPDVSHNCLGRAYLLAKVLQRRYQVEIVGPAFQGKIWEPLAGQDEVKIQVVPGYPLFYKGISQMRAIRKNITGDVIYASKPLLTSYGVGLAEKFFHQKPLVLDVDDWQMGFQKEALKRSSLMGQLRRFILSTLRFSSPGSYWNSLLGERLVALADEITVSNGFLKAKFGGIIVPHGRDCDVLNPERFDKKILRTKLRICKGKKVVSFIGTPMPYKGVEDLVDAINLLQDRRILLMLVGLKDNSYCSMLREVIARKLREDQVRLFGLEPFRNLPEFLAISDLVVIPQRKNPATVGQVPAKVFDAMAMSKPIIATGVSDLPEILDSCGWIVHPENSNQLAKVIRYVFDHPDEAEEMGWKARGKCIEQYSWNAMEEVLLGIFRKYE